MQRPIPWQIVIVLYVEWVLLYTLRAFYAHTSNVWQKASATWQACGESISSQAVSLQCDRIAEEIRRGVDYQAYLVEPFLRSLISGAIATVLVFALSRWVRRNLSPVE